MDESLDGGFHCLIVCFRDIESFSRPARHSIPVSARFFFHLHPIFNVSVACSMTAIILFIV